MGLVVFIGFIVLGLCAIIAMEFQRVAADKGYTGSRYYWYPFLFGIFGMLLIIALPDRGGKNQTPIILTEAPKSASAADEIPDL